jgi:hypothetical protein
VFFVIEELTAGLSWRLQHDVFPVHGTYTVWQIPNIFKYLAYLHPFQRISGKLKQNDES